MEIKEAFRLWIESLNEQLSFLVIQTLLHLLHEEIHKIIRMDLVFVNGVKHAVGEVRLVAFDFANAQPERLDGLFVR